LNGPFEKTMQNRREAMIKMMLGGMIPGALVGAIIGFLASIGRDRDLPFLIGGGLLAGLLLGGAIGALIGDHQNPP
jgi:hypothetical protein